MNPLRSEFCNNAGLLSRTDIEPITIGALLRMELDALGTAASDNRITLSGPSVILRDTIVQTLALAIYELATNARKYGALAADDRTLTVTWAVRQVEGATPNLALEWVEAGVGSAPKEESATRKGYGRELIEHALPHSLNATTSFEMNNDGLR